MFGGKPKGSGDFVNDRNRALKKGKQEKAVVIKVMAGQYYVGTDVKKAMQSFRESTAYLGKAKPKIIADYR